MPVKSNEEIATELASEESKRSARLLFLTGVEVGFRKAEKGLTLEAALEDARKSVSAKWPMYTSETRAALIFLSLASIIAGLAIMLSLPYNPLLNEHIPEAVVGVLLLAGGLTYFWRHSRFYRM